MYQSCSRGLPRDICEDEQGRAKMGERKEHVREKWVTLIEGSSAPIARRAVGALRMMDKTKVDGPNAQRG